MKARVLEAMMLTMLWYDRDDFCKNWPGCKGCPFDMTNFHKKKICDKVSTEFVLERGAKAYKEYFEEINYLIPSIEDLIKLE